MMSQSRKKETTITVKQQVSVITQLEHKENMALTIVFNKTLKHFIQNI